MLTIPVRVFNISKSYVGSESEIGEYLNAILEKKYDKITKMKLNYCRQCKTLEHHQYRYLINQSDEIKYSLNWCSQTKISDLKLVFNNPIVFDKVKKNLTVEKEDKELTNEHIELIKNNVINIRIRELKYRLIPSETDLINIPYSINISEELENIEL